MALLCVSATAAACPICLGAGQPTKAQELASAEQAVLAVPTADASRFRVIEVVHGERPSSSTIEGGHPRNGPAADATAPKGKPLLLVRTDPFPAWVILGAIGTEQSGWLRKFAAGKRPQDMSAEDWRARVALMLPYLENAEPLVAELAYGELAAAPYAAMRTAKPQLDARRIRAWLTDPQLAARQRLYLLLLGFAGTASDAAALDQRLEAAWKSGDATNLASMLAADLELRGAARMAWIDEKISARPRALCAGDLGGTAGAFRARQRERRNPARASDPVLPHVHEAASGDRRIRRTGPRDVAVLGRGAGVRRADEIRCPTAVPVQGGDYRVPAAKPLRRGARARPSDRGVAGDAQVTSIFSRDRRAIRARFRYHCSVSCRSNEAPIARATGSLSADRRRAVRRLRAGP